MEDGHPQAAADREHGIACGFDGEQFAHLSELVGHLGGQVVGLGPVLVEVVQLPAVVVGCPVVDARRHPGSQGTRGPNADAIQPS